MNDINTFDNYMQNKHRLHFEALREEHKDNDLVYDALYKPFTEWFDDFSYEEICDYADLYSEETSN